MMRHLVPAILLGAALSVPASAQDQEIGYPDGSLAYRTLMAADYAGAEKQLRTDARVRSDDPAKLINYGIALAKTGHVVAARRTFDQVLNEEEIELILADGSNSNSHDVARRGLAMLRSGR